MQTAGSIPKLQWELRISVYEEQRRRVDVMLKSEGAAGNLECVRLAMDAVLGFLRQSLRSRRADTQWHLGIGCIL